ncbi:hypothetical protein JKP88DRAFT_282899 [Tribonema minus]|uniref:Uncharacterized protein n=1 Tax=Tribonema minus TaxID=303371 RepID=A0A835YIM4_9STRA|nr:hypothetical protein JKP88DRAFT_282899 [Tribonema minus]
MSGKMDNQNTVFAEVDDTPQITTRSQAGKKISPPDMYEPGNPDSTQLTEATEMFEGEDEGVGASTNGNAISSQTAPDEEYVPPTNEPGDEVFNESDYVKPSEAYDPEVFAARDATCASKQPARLRRRLPTLLLLQQPLMLEQLLLPPLLLPPE